MQLWSAASPLTISETLESSDADIHLQYSTKQHGDNFPFDSQGGVLAHAFYPHSGQLAGHVHFDDDERWSHDPRQGATSSSLIDRIAYRGCASKKKSLLEKNSVFHQR